MKLVCLFIVIPGNSKASLLSVLNTSIGKGLFPLECNPLPPNTIINPL